MYVVVNSRAYDPKNLNTGIAPWRIAMYLIDAVVAILLVLLMVRACKIYRTAKKEA
jgi:beta-glucosidase